jgi:hypothetical protein
MRERKRGTPDLDSWRVALGGWIADVHQAVDEGAELTEAGRRLYAAALEARALVDRVAYERTMRRLREDALRDREALDSMRWRGALDEPSYRRLVARVESSTPAAARRWDGGDAVLLRAVTRTLRDGGWSQSETARIIDDGGGGDLDARTMRVRNRLR